MGSLSDKFRRLAVLLEPEVERMAARQAAHIGDFDDAQFDAAQELATFFRGDAAVWQCHAEPIGRLNPDYGLFRWFWHGRSAHAKRSRLDSIIKEGQGYQISELTTDHVEVADEGEAHLLAKVAAQIGRAEGVLRVEDEYGISFIALFEGGPAPRALRKLAPRQNVGHDAAPNIGGEVALDAPSSVRLEAEAPLSARDPRFSVPSPAAEVVAAFAAHDRPASSFVHTIPPTPVHDLGVAALAVRIPSREVVGPLVSAALAHVTHEMGDFFTQALLVVVVEASEAKRRFFVHVVASDATGDLRSLDATPELTSLASKVIADDARSGNGRWRKLLVRLRKTARGAQVEVDVRA